MCHSCSCYPADLFFFCTPISPPASSIPRKGREKQSFQHHIAFSGSPASQTPAPPTVRRKIIGLKPCEQELLRGPVFPSFQHFLGKINVVHILCVLTWFCLLPGLKTSSLCLLAVSLFFPELFWHFWPHAESDPSIKLLNVITKIRKVGRLYSF